MNAHQYFGLTATMAALFLASERTMQATPIQFTGQYSQDFDSLGNSGSSSAVPGGWAFAEPGGDGAYNASTGSSTGGGVYSFGAAGSTERALGMLRTGGVNPIIGAALENASGDTITSLLISYMGEQWRLGYSGRGPDRLDFQYSLDAVSLTAGTWVNVDSMNFEAPVATGSSGALDGNSAANRVLISSSLTGLAWNPGATLWIRWTDFDAPNSDDGLGIDDFSMNVQGSAPVSVPESLPFGMELIAILGVIALYRTTRNSKRIV